MVKSKERLKKTLLHFKDMMIFPYQMFFRDSLRQIADIEMR